MWRLLFRLPNLSLSCWSEFYFCIFSLFESWSEAFCVELIVSIFGVLLMVSKFQRRSSASAWSFMLNKRSLCYKKHDLDANSCLYLEHDAGQALIRICDLCFSCCWNVLVCKRHVALSRADNISTSMLFISTYCFCLFFVCWEMFVLSGSMSNPALSVLCLKSHIIFWSCTSEKENKSTSSAKHKFVKQSDRETPKRMPMPFVFCQHSTTFSNVIWSTVLKKEQAGQKITLFRSPHYLEHVSFFVCQDCFRVSHPLQADILWFDTTFFESVPLKMVCYRAQCPHEFHCRERLFDTPTPSICSSNLYVARWSNKNIQTHPGLLISHGQVFCKICWKWLLRGVLQKMLAECKSGKAIVTNVFHISLFLDHFYTYYYPCFLRAILLLQHSVEDLSDHFFSRFVACLDVFSLDSIVISCFTFSEATCGNSYFILCELWYFHSSRLRCNFLSRCSLLFPNF